MLVVVLKTIEIDKKIGIFILDMGNHIRFGYCKIYD